MRIKLFFYGSLRKGEFNFERFEREWPGALVEVGAGSISGWELVDLGAYPSVVPGDVRSSVAGEVYEVSAEFFEHVEELEAEADYRRHTVTVQMKDGQSPVEAFVYFFSRPAELTDRPRIESGDWKRRGRA